MDDTLGALRASVERLHRLATGLDDAQLVGASYCREWSIADVLSHIGSGAVIGERGLRDGIAGSPAPDDFAPGVWDTWNAKTPRAKVDDGLVADRALLEAFEAVTEADRARATFSVGPLSLDFVQFAGMRLNEHVFHTWDVEVALDGTARLGESAVPVVVDNLGLIARFTAKPTGIEERLHIRTTDPARDATVVVKADAVELTDGATGQPDLVLPAEAWCRLVYGRLDPDHTPAFTGDPGALDSLRRVFPGP